MANNLYLSKDLVLGHVIHHTRKFFLNIQGVYTFKTGIKREKVLSEPSSFSSPPAA